MTHDSNSVTPNVFWNKDVKEPAAVANAAASHPAGVAPEDTNS